MTEEQVLAQLNRKWKPIRLVEINLPYGVDTVQI